jgi:hypothetical protein
MLSLLMQSRSTPTNNSPQSCLADRGECLRAQSPYHTCTGSIALSISAGSTCCPLWSRSMSRLIS